MRKYLANLKNKPDHHKKQFAFLASGTITLFIFGIWSLTTFGIAKDIVVEENQEVGPFETVRSNLAASFQAIGENIGLLEESVKTLDLEASYINLREGALDTYGR